MIIKRITSLPTTLPELMTEARAEGFKFLDRLVADFDSGENRFSATNEALFVVSMGHTCVGIGGVNQDPISHSPLIGRLRRVYVATAMRGQGTGRELIQTIEQWCVGKFDELQLFTDSAAASGFYESLGYEKLNAARISHRKLLASQTERP